jgi:hypothetical protein
MRLNALLDLMTQERRAGAPVGPLDPPLVPPSLDAIIARCLAPEPSRRYARAADLAEDLQRFLDDRPNAHAPEPSLGERLAKWWRRHPQIRGAGPVAAASGVLLVAVLLGTWTLFDYASRTSARLARDHFSPSSPAASSCSTRRAGGPGFAVRGSTWAEAPGHVRRADLARLGVGGPGCGTCPGRSAWPSASRSPS